MPPFLRAKVGTTYTRVMADVLRPADRDRENRIFTTNGSAHPPAEPRRWALPLVMLVYLAVYGRAMTLGFVWDDSVNSAQSALLRGPLSSELADGELPAASLAVEVIRLAENLGRPVDNALRAIKDRLAIVTSEDGALCHARNTLPPRRTSRFSCQLLRVPFQPTMFHVTHIG